MANAYTSIQSGASLGVNLVQTGYEKLVDFKLRSTPLFRKAVVDKRATALTNPGTTVTFNLYRDLTPDTNTLTEEVVPDSVRIPQTDTVSVTVNEMGKTIIDTLLLRSFTFSDIDPAVANLVARDQAESLDLRVRAPMDASTHRYGTNGGLVTTAVGSLTSAMVLDAKSVAQVNTLFRRANVVESMPMDTFGAFIHPDVAYDLRAATGSGSWLFPHENVAPENIWLARVGVFNGVSFVESPRVKTALDGSGGTQANQIYRSYFFGAQALVEVMAIEPHIIIGPQTDPMLRFRPLSWYGIGGWNIYRNEALIRLESGSSLASLS